MTRHDEHVRGIERREVLNVVKPADLIVGNASYICPLRGGDCRVCLDIVGFQLHDAEAGVGDQDILMAILLVGDHVNRLVAGAQVGDLSTFHLRARLQFADRDLHQRSAGVCSEHILLAGDIVRNKGADRSLRFITAMRRVPDLERRALLGGLERERNRTQRRTPFFVRETRHHQIAIDVGP
jgi:hypothetical protein